MSATDETLPNLAEILGRVLLRVPAERRPLLIAYAERLAAERYREWSRGTTDSTRKARLAACAEREEEIARQVESLFPEASNLQREILAANPDLEEVNRSIFAGRPLRQQFAIQAQGERLGAATWRSLAPPDENSPARRIFLACAELEEESARVLEAILEEPR